MDLLERYLQAVGRSLPLATRQDTLAELRANLLAQLDAQQEATGHPPTQLEVEALLYQHGHPAVVASRYLSQRSLIGPELYPFYVLTLRRALPLVVFVSLIAYTVALMAVQRPTRLSSYAFEAAIHLVPVLLTWWAIVTAIFSVIEYIKGKFWDGNLIKTWKLSSLPALDEPLIRKPLSQRVADFAVHGVLTVYLLVTPFHPFLLLGPGAWYLSALSLTLSPSLRTIYTLLLGLLLAQLCVKAVTLFGRRARWHPLLDLGIKLVGFGVIVWMIHSDLHLVALATPVDLSVLTAFNRGLEVACKLALIISLTDIVWSIWKYAQSSQAGRWLMV